MMVTLPRVQSKHPVQSQRPLISRMVEFYEQLFRLRGLPYPPPNIKMPPYIGHLTNISYMTDWHPA